MVFFFTNYIPKLAEEPIATFPYGSSSFEFSMWRPVHKMICDGYENEMSYDLLFWLKTEFSKIQLLFCIPEKNFYTPPEFIIINHFRIGMIETGTDIRNLAVILKNSQHDVAEGGTVWFISSLDMTRRSFIPWPHMLHGLTKIPTVYFDAIDVKRQIAFTFHHYGDTDFPTFIV